MVVFRVLPPYRDGPPIDVLQHVHTTRLLVACRHRHATPRTHYAGLLFLLWQLDEHRDDNCERTLHAVNLIRALECVNARVSERMVKRNSTGERFANDALNWI